MSKTNVTMWSNEFYAAIQPAIDSVGFHPSEPGWDSGPQCRIMDDFDIWYAIAGEGEVKIDGKWVHFAKGDLITLMPGNDYQQERRFGDGISEVYFSHFLPFGPGQEQLDSLLADHWPAKMSLSHAPHVESLFVEMLENYASAAEGYQLPTRATMLGILDVIFETIRRHVSDELPPAFGRLLRAQRYIETNFAEELTLDDIAEHAELSASYLMASFRKHFATSPIQYQLNCRMTAARLMLARGSSVTETADKTGFSSLHYFSRTFRKRQGLSPQQFARQCRRHRLGTIVSEVTRPNGDH